MKNPSASLIRKIAACGAAALLLMSCGRADKGPPLSRSEELVRNAPVPPENGPKLGVISEILQVYAATEKSQATLGLLHAGARVARSERPVSRSGCEGGWYAIRPRGFACAGTQATLDLAHPTLAAMALPPSVDASLPYTYARARVETPLFERSPGAEEAVHEVGKLRRRAGMAVVGSWKARDPSGKEARLALLTSGRFVRAEDLEAAKPSEFQGVELTKERQLPVAFVVKRGVRSFRVEGNEAEKGDLLDYHALLPLSGRFRNLGTLKYWALEAPPGQERWVRHRDVTVVQKRTIFPDFVADDTRWVDVSVVTGTLTLYEGKRALFTTLLSVVRDLAAGGGDTQPAADGPRPIALGTFPIQQKYLTVLGKDPAIFGEPYEVQDVPWALELGSGQLIHGAYWHDRFGIEHGAGTFALAPADAARVFRFVTPELPDGWHATSARAGEASTQVVIRK